MTFPERIKGFFHYLFYPVTILFAWLIIILAPIVHLGHYVLYGLVMPLRILGKFETLYIFFGVAAVIGILTGSVLHLSSSFLVTALNLESVPAEHEPLPLSIAAARRKKRAERSEVPMAKLKQRPTIDTSLIRDYTVWLEKDRGRRKNGLLSTTILEEEDDVSEGIF
ncbi:MAG: hypothetical protein M1836_002456 [Candelina mexicana]|nr:MAG: hypothetical protein M1836_002456 [Candelina mexicana]